METAELSNSFSTGGGGINFERYVQAVFLLALLIDGVSPVLDKQVIQLDFQGKRLGYDTDDLIITVAGKNEAKLLFQIKHDITITSQSELFNDVLNSAWSDFQKNTFQHGIDKVVLATGIIAKDTVFAFRYLYDQSISSGDENDFFARILQEKFTSEKTREKFNVLRDTIKKANGNNESDKRVIWEFCKSFVLLVFDLDFKSSVNQMLLLYLIRCRSSESPAKVWGKLFEYAAFCDQSGACVRLNNIPDDIKEMFNIRDNFQAPAKIEQQFMPSELWVQLSLIGSWDEKKEDDIKIIEHITGLSYNKLRSELQQLINFQPNIILCQNRTWKILNRLEIFRLCEKCFSDQTIERVFETAEEILKLKNKRFDKNGNFSLLIPETGSFQNSLALRRGIISGLCIIANSNLNLITCSNGICEKCSYSLFTRAC